MTRVSNQTNNLDPTSVNSRIFVGNLNTYLVGKEDLEALFARYGRVIAISMHKGYAFIQYTDPYDARNAVLGEDGRTVAGQVIDVNMVSEPKPHQQTRKRQGSPRDSLDVLPDRPLSAVLGGPPSPALVLTPPNCKRSRTGPMGPCSPLETVLIMHGAFNGASRIKTKPLRPPTPTVPAVCNDADVLVCGVCKQVFSCLQGLLDHKRRPCRLRFTCRCQDVGAGANSRAPPTPQCKFCDAQCCSWWDLINHSEEAHGVAIYRPTEEPESGQRSEQQSEPGSPSCADPVNEQPMCVSSADSPPAEDVENEGKVNEAEDQVCNENSSSLEVSDSEEEHSEESTHTGDSSMDKCVDTTDLQNGQH